MVLGIVVLNPSCHVLVADKFFVADKFLLLRFTQLLDFLGLFSCHAMVPYTYVETVPNWNPDF